MNNKYACVETIYIQTDKIKDAQLCVASSGGRFIYNPIEIFGKYEFKVGFHSIKDMNLFNRLVRDYEYLNVKDEKTKKPWWKLWK